jgi:CRISPR system Cascade subunit CasB
MVASYFAQHPRHDSNGRSLGAVFARPELGDHESAAKRFVALLNSRADDLPARLRQAIRLVASSDIPINYLELLWNLLQWRMPDRRIQYKWARQRWGYLAPEATDEAATVTTNEGE